MNMKNYSKKAYSNISNSFSEKPPEPTVNSSILESRIVSLELKVSLMAREMMAQKKIINQLLEMHQSSETISDDA